MCTCFQSDSILLRSFVSVFRDISLYGCAVLFVCKCVYVCVFLCLCIRETPTLQNESEVSSSVSSSFINL